MQKKHGKVDITATSSNGKTSILKINVKDLQQIENSNLIKTSTVSTTNKNNNNSNNKKEDSNPLAGFLTVGALGGMGYWGYRKFKK